MGIYKNAEGKGKGKNTLRLYEDGAGKVKAEEEMKNFWNKIYRKHENERDSVWNYETKEYIKEYNKTQTVKSQ